MQVERHCEGLATRDAADAGQPVGRPASAEHGGNAMSDDDITSSSGDGGAGCPRAGGNARRMPPAGALAESRAGRAASAGRGSSAAGGGSMGDASGDGEPGRGGRQQRVQADSESSGGVKELTLEEIQVILKCNMPCFAS